jgi:predicted transposase/invertase (TIGR01784 family)
MKNEQEKEINDKIANPHDKVVRTFFATNEIAKNFFLEYLPSHITRDIDFSTLEISKDTFIDKKSYDIASDILYQVNLRNTKAFIYLLIEHKSYKYHLIAFQLLKYMVGIWDLYLKQNKNARTLPVILPLVIYHGKEKWDIDTNFNSLFPENNPEYAKESIPDFKFNLFDISHVPDEEIKGEILLRILFQTLKHVKFPELAQKLPGIFRLFLELEDKRKGTEYLEVILRYLASSTNDLKEGDLRESVTKTIIEGGDIMSTIADNWMKIGIDKGVEIGIDKGVKIGKNESTLNFAINSLKEGIPIKLISKITHLTEDELEQLKTKIGNAKTLMKDYESKF